MEAKSDFFFVTLQFGMAVAKAMLFIENDYIMTKKNFNNALSCKYMRIDGFRIGGYYNS